MKSRCIGLVEKKKKPGGALRGSGNRPKIAAPFYGESNYENVYSD